jgi:hypothetical protein
MGFNWAVYADEVKAAGGFDPRFGPGSPTGALGDETDLQRRLHARGARKVNVPEAIVAHAVPAERCTEAWALRRFYQQGVALGLAERQRGARAEAARSALALLKNGLLYPVSLAQRDAVAAMRARASLHGRAGFFRGYFARPVA